MQFFFYNFYWLKSYGKFEIFKKKDYNIFPKIWAKVVKKVKVEFFESL
jgi:hypothetical protein